MNNQRIAILARQSCPLFHTKDLAVLWNITNPNTLYTILKRYTKKNLLYRIYKGLYSLITPQDLDPLLLGTKAVHEYVYVSTETVLIQAGLVAQMMYDMTLISSKSCKFSIIGRNYVVRKLNNKFLFIPTGIYEKNGVKIATVDRAIADLLYFNPRVIIDGKRLIDMKKLQEIQKAVGYPLTHHFYADS